MTLCILAAGMGSRYGGLKQLDPMTKNGEFIIDFSIYDAIEAGFDRVVFIIKKENYELFRRTIGERVERYIRVEYAFQDLYDIPSGFTVPEGRVKPWGTSQALLAARDILDDEFMIVNADDFYGRDAFSVCADFLRRGNRAEAHFCMVGYVLRNTLTENGTVSRGVCECDEQGMLSSIVERTKIRVCGDGAEYLCDDEWVYADGDTPVSMNCWGLTPAIFPYLEKGFEDFLSQPTNDPLKREYYLPMAIGDMMSDGLCDVKVIKTQAKWHGVTYSEDKAEVLSSIRALIESGEYPDGLWK